MTDNSARAGPSNPPSQENESSQPTTDSSGSVPTLSSGYSTDETVPSCSSTQASLSQRDPPVALNEPEVEEGVVVELSNTGEEGIVVQSSETVVYSTLDSHAQKDESSGSQDGAGPPSADEAEDTTEVTPMKQASSEVHEKEEQHSTVTENDTQSEYIPLASDNQEPLSDDMVKQTYIVTIEKQPELVPTDDKQLPPGDRPPAELESPIIESGPLTQEREDTPSSMEAQSEPFLELDEDEEPIPVPGNDEGVVNNGVPMETETPVAMETEVAKQSETPAVVDVTPIVPVKTASKRRKGLPRKIPSVKTKPSPTKRSPKSATKKPAKTKSPKHSTPKPVAQKMPSADSTPQVADQQPITTSTPREEPVSGERELDQKCLPPKQRMARRKISVQPAITREKPPAVEVVECNFTEQQQASVGEETENSVEEPPETSVEHQDTTTEDEVGTSTSFLNATPEIKSLSKSRSPTVRTPWEIAEKRMLVAEAKQWGIRPTARRHNMSFSTLRVWMAQDFGDLPGSKKRLPGGGRPLRYDQSVDEELKDWVLKKMAMNERVSHDELREKAMELILPYNPDFQASQGWISRFLFRHQINLKTKVLGKDAHSPRVKQYHSPSKKIKTPDSSITSTPLGKRKVAPTPPSSQKKKQRSEESVEKADLSVFDFEN